MKEKAVKIAVNIDFFFCPIYLHKVHQRQRQNDRPDNCYRDITTFIFHKNLLAADFVRHNRTIINR